MVEQVAIHDNIKEKNTLAIMPSPPKQNREPANNEPDPKSLKTGTLPMQPGTNTNLEVADAAALILQAVKKKRQKVAEAKSYVKQTKPGPKKKAASTPKKTTASPADGCATPLNHKPVLPESTQKEKAKVKDEFQGFISHERSRSQFLARGHGNSAKGKTAAGALKSFKYAHYGGEEGALQEAKRWLVQNKFV